ncbi:unnamed protein product [Pelagomonas calceolata]|uniref:PIPK domain-containing protein n=1 Tax=Pelagomonas calceolata TaxID=35677 RepID=A0A8J2SDF0_9STRA|nr:unnamed protein product [Pelagomonas calceolata]
MTERETSAGFHVGGETVQTYNDEHYKKLRERWGLGDDFLATFDFTKNMKGGGGKGGDLMGFTTDKLFIVKEVNPGDQKSLLKITEDYAQHLLDPHGSLLARFFLHFSRKGKDFLVMNNWMPPPRYDAVDSMEELGFDLKTNYNRFDLKGCADDKTLVALGEPVHAVHKRIFNVGMWCGDALWTPERKRYFEGKKHAREVKFHVSQATHDEISKQTKRDVAFLQKWGLMDYSLVVSYHGVPRTHLDVARSVYAGTSDGGAQPYLAASKDTLYISYVGIIDFLQDWTCAKKVAMCVKCCERNKATIPPVPYGDRFASFVDAKFVGDCAPVPEVVALDATP